MYHKFKIDDKVKQKHRGLFAMGQRVGIVIGFEPSDEEDLNSNWYILVCFADRFINGKEYWGWKDFPFYEWEIELVQPLDKQLYLWDNL